MLSIKSRREALGLSQKDFAERLKVSERTVRYWESGDVHPGRRMDEIALELNCHPADLFTAPVAEPKSEEV